MPLAPRSARIAIAAATGLAAMFAAVAASAHEPDPTKLPIGDGKLSDAPQGRLHLGLPHRPRPRRRPARRAVDGLGQRHLDMTEKVAVEGAVSWPHSFTIEKTATAASSPGTACRNTRPASSRSRATIPPTSTTPTPTTSASARCEIALPLEPQLAASQPARPTRSACCSPASCSSTRSTRRAATPSPMRRRTPARAIRASSASITITACRIACSPKSIPAAGPSKLVGYAVDGFGIYGPRDENGNDAVLGRSRRLPRPHEPGRMGGQDGDHVSLRRHARLPLHVGCLKGAWSQDTCRPSPARRRSAAVRRAAVRTARVVRAWGATPRRGAPGAAGVASGGYPRF